VASYGPKVVQALPGPVTRSEPLSTAPFGWRIVLTIRQPGEPEAVALSEPPATTSVTAVASPARRAASFIPRTVRPP
jgi:hypothetical protein